MGKMLQQMERGERCWPAELLLRSGGLLLLCLCVVASLWLSRAVNAPPPHQPDALEMADALVAVICGSAGGALLTVGPGLFRLVDLPARYARFTTKKGSSS